MLDPATSLALLAGTFLVSRLLGHLLSGRGSPAIVVELAVGFLVGNLLASPMQAGGILGIAEVGVVLLFFLVGLEIDLRRVAEHRATVLRIGLVSALAPATAFFLLAPSLGLPLQEGVYVAAVLMTSGTGMVMRVLRERGQVATPSGRVILGSSVLDDIPAVLMLAAAQAYAVGESFSAVESVIVPVFTLAGFAVVAIVVARERFTIRLAPSFLLPILLLASWIAQVAGLTSLLGALLVGMVFRRWQGEDLFRYLRPLSSFLIPAYFITVGMAIPATSLADPHCWALGGGLALIALGTRAIAITGLADRARREGFDRWAVMWGMVPRGLPGLVFATMGHQMGHLSDLTFAALVLMVTITNIVGLTVLSLRLGARPSSFVTDD